MMTKEELQRSATQIREYVDSIAITRAKEKASVLRAKKQNRERGCFKTNEVHLLEHTMELAATFQSIPKL